MSDGVYFRMNSASPGIYLQLRLTRYAISALLFVGVPSSGCQLYGFLQDGWTMMTFSFQVISEGCLDFLSHWSADKALIKLMEEQKVFCRSRPVTAIYTLSYHFSSSSLFLPSEHPYYFEFGGKRGQPLESTRAAGLKPDTLYGRCHLKCPASIRPR